MLKLYWELLYLFCMYTWLRIFLWYKLIFLTVMFYRSTYKNSGFCYLSLFLCHPPELFVSSAKDYYIFLSYSILKIDIKFLVNLTPQLKISWRLFSSETKRKKIPDYQKEFLMLNMKHPADNVSRLLKSYLKKKVENVFPWLHTLCYPCPSSRWQVHWV